MGGSSLAPEVLRQRVRGGALPRPRHDAPRADPARSATRSIPSGRSSSSPRSRGRRSRRARHLDYFWERAARGPPLRRDHRPGLRAGGDRARARLPRRLPRRADDRRPLLGAVAVRARARGADGRRRSTTCSSGAVEMARGVPRSRRTRASTSACGSARAGGRGRDKVALRPNAVGFGLWAEQLLAESTGKQGEGHCAGARRVVGRPRPPARRGARRRPVRPRPPSSTAGSSRPPSRATSSGINPFDQPDVQAAKDQDRGRPPVRGRARRRARRLRRGAARAGASPATTSRSRRSSTPPASATSLRSSSGRARPAAPSPYGLGPRFLHSTGQLHKGGPEHRALRCRSWTTPATSCGFRASNSASGGCYARRRRETMQR